MHTNHEPIHVLSSRYGAPGHFFWRGKGYHIDKIDQIWRHPYGKRTGRRIYRVHSRGRRFILHYDQKQKRWYLVRSPWRVRLSMAVERLASRIAA